MGERYQREIEEILQQVDQEKGTPRPRARKATPRRSPAGGAGWRFSLPRVSVSPGKLMLVSLALLLSALIVSRIQPGFVGFFLWTGLLLFLVAYALFFIRPSVPREKRWRGRVIEEAEPWWKRFRRRSRP